MAGTEVATRSAATLLDKLGARYMPGTGKAEVLSILKATAFKVKDGEATNAQVAALLVVADQYNLNPWTRELFAFPDKQNGIVPVVSVDGWNRIANAHEAYNGEELVVPAREEWVQIDDDAKLAPPYMTVRVYRKDREVPTEHTEYLDEVYRPAFVGKGRNGETYTKPGPWQSHTKRMLEHKARIQARRIAFGFAGIFDEDEALRIVEAGEVVEGEVVEEFASPVAVADLVRIAADRGVSAETLAEWAAVLGFHGSFDSLPVDVYVKLSEALAGYTPPEDPDDDGAEGEEASQEAEEASPSASEAEGGSEAVEPLFGEEAPSSAPAPASRMAPTVTAPQLTRLGALWGDLERLGVEEKALRADLETFAGVSSRKELSKAKASEYIDHLLEKSSWLKSALGS